MRKYISLILLIIFLFVTNGYYLYFKYLQEKNLQTIKSQIKNELTKKTLTLIIISSENDTQLEWTKENTEFSYKGSMYDVVKTEKKDNLNYYYCINDIKEKQLIINYTRQNRRRNKVLLRLKKLLSTKYFPEKNSICQRMTKTEISFSDNQKRYKSVDLETLSPPPKI